MNLNLSSEIVLNQVSADFYSPKSEVERSQVTRCEKIPTDIYPNVDEASRKIADDIEREIRRKDANNQMCVLGLGTGTSLTPVYAELARRHQEEGLSFRNVIVFNVYEYYPLKPDAQNSCIEQLRQRFLNHVDIKETNIHTFDFCINQDKVREHCRHYEQLIAEAGGIDAMMLGLGRLGNIGTNVPGSSMNSGPRLILLDPIIREELSLSFGNNEQIPATAMTMGVGTILSARKIFLTAWGDEKASIIQKTVEGRITDTLPASFLQTHKDAHVVIDLSAASRLTRMVHPWLVASCEWTDKLVRSALVWLCQETGKPILKLTNKDYNEHGLSELLALYGSAYNANIKIFNDLQHTITGWPGGKPNADDTYRPERALPYPKRVIIFSPHPDDDVISMGGTLRRLVVQGHDVHVAYETSGNIAKQFLAQKKDGDMDTQDIRTIKGLIRRGEARTASTFNEIPLDHVHFLDLPFYESGKIEKLPMGEADVDIVRQLLEQVQPHQIYVAGDLADPHGTHKKCTDAVLAALDCIKQEEPEGWISDCRVWMYRGAWAEWEIENIEMCVPMSPEELRAKRNAILKHQSQMESAPFLGNDERLFWQRAEDRNRATAKLYDDLGLACYEAMEAFVEYKMK